MRSFVVRARWMQWLGLSMLMGGAVRARADGEALDDRRAVAPLGGRVTWQPTPAEIRVVDAKLDERLALGVMVDGRRKALSPEYLAGYRRRYNGIHRRQGRAIVIELACSVDEWPPHGSILREGKGSCFLEVVWDVPSSKVASIVANSEK